MLEIQRVAGNIDLWLVVVVDDVGRLRLGCIGEGLTRGD